jgi:hypothetical protein
VRNLAQSEYCLKKKKRERDIRELFDLEESVRHPGGDRSEP